MLPRAEAPARRLPYTTADMSERLAKRKAEQEAAAQAQANQALRFGVTNPPAVKKDEPWYRDALGAVGGAIKSVYENIPMSNPVSTPVNMGGDAGVSMGGQGTVKSLVTEPARLAVRRAVGDITAIPRVGEPSPSYTADQIRDQGVALGVLGAAIDYSQFIPVVAKGAGFTGDAVNAYKLAMMERQANPFPALRGASNVIDVVPGSRLPARVVEPPTPATRLGESLAQRTLDARAAQVGVRDAGVLRMPGSYPAGERYVFDYNQSDPAYVIDKQSTNAISRSYDKVGPGEKLIDTKGTETGVPGRSYTSNKMVALQSPQGNATLGYDIETRVINGTPQPRIVLQPISAAKGSIAQVKQLLDFLYGRYKNAVIDWGNISTELPNELFYEYNNRFPVRTVGESVGNPLENFNAPKTNINVLLDTPQRGAIPYTELYDAIGVLDNNRIYPTSEFKQLIQKFGLQGREREVLDAFARREGIVEPSRLSSWQKFVNEMQRQIDMGDYFNQ